MRVLKILGVVVTVTALFCGLGVVGRMETEDRQYVCGEITRDDMTTDKTLFKWFGVIGAAALAGGLMWVVGTYNEKPKRIGVRYDRGV